MDLYAEITDRIIAELEKGIIPWRKPWTGVRSGAWSRSTGRPYSLLNQMILGKPGEYLTFKQCQDAGGHVRKGEKAKPVVFWKMLPVTEKDADGNPIQKIIPLLKYYNVFHVDQCEGITPKHNRDNILPPDPIAEAEAIAKEYTARSGCRIDHTRGDKACYRPSTDQVIMPLREQFTKPAEYYSTLFHELTHSTGHVSRLNRLDKTAAFGNEEYSKEELVAEIGAAACLNDLGIETPSSFKNSVAYVQSWLRALRNDKRLIISAAGKAEKAVNLLFNRQMDTVKEAAA